MCPQLPAFVPQRRHIARACASILACLLIWAPATAQFAVAPTASGDAAAALARTTAAAAAADYERNLAAYRDNPDMLVRPGLLADRKDKSVTLWARATSVSVHDPIEFFIIPQDSGKDYEALFVTFARPSHVHEALEFIGMRPGRSIDFARNRFWPKGERVIVTAEWQQPPPAGAEGEAPAVTRVRVERLIYDERARRTMREDGLVFVGSYWIEPEDGSQRIYAADAMDSRSIASNYNNRETVLDVPRQAPQSAVYGTQKLNPQYRFTPGQPVSLTIRPERPQGPPRVVDLELRVSMPPGASGPQGAAYELLDARGTSLLPRPTLIHLLAEFERLTDGGRDPFVTVVMDRAMTLGAVRQVYQVLAVLDDADGIRIEPPPPGDLYYRAFFPDEKLRDRGARLGKPWEAHLLYRDHQVAGTLILPADEIDDNNGQGDLKFTVGTPQELARILADRSGRFSRSVYIFAPGTLPYGAMLSFIGPAMKTHPSMLVFLPQ